MANNGEFFWLERCPGLPVADALADVLLGRARRRQAPASSSVSLPPSDDEPTR